jgi:sugar/nucleoside kinase (ribokinase family)
MNSKDSGIKVKKEIDVVGIGDILVDILVDVSEEELSRMNISKGVHELISLEKRDHILNTMNGNDQQFKVGGYMLTAMKAMSSLGLKTHLTTKVGMDEFGLVVQKELNKLRTEFDFKVGFGCTDSRLTFKTPDTEKTRHHHVGISKNISYKDINSVKIKQAKNLLIESQLLDNSPRLRLAQFITRIASESECNVVFDLNDVHSIIDNKENVLQLLTTANTVIAPLDLAYLLFEENDIQKLLAKMKQTASVAVLKTGKEYIVSNETETYSIGKMKELSPYHDEYFTAGFLFGQNQEYGLEKSAILGSYLASKQMIDDSILDELHKVFK